MKLTETKLRNIIREELKRLEEEQAFQNDVANNFHRFLTNVGRQDGSTPGGYRYEDLYFHVDPMGGFATFVNVFRDRNDSESVASAKIEGDKVQLSDKDMPRGASDRVKYRGPKQTVKALVARAKNPSRDFGAGR